MKDKIFNMCDIQSGIKLNNLQFEGHWIGTWEGAALDFVWPYI